MSEIDESDYISIKVVLLGETTVGKTSIITRFTTNVFEEHVLSTNGSNFTTEKIELDNNNKVKLQIWDTAGQEKFRSLAKLFYQSASVVILVYDITNEQSFIAIKEYWSNEIKNNCSENVIIAIVANKNDEYLNQTVPTEDGKELAKKLNAIFINTSAKSGIGIDNLFRTVAEKYIDPTKDISNTYLNREETKEKNKKIILKKKKKTDKGKRKKCCSN